MVRRRAAAAFLLFALVAMGASATDLRVDRDRIHADESIAITLTLTDDFAALDRVNLPIQNLKIDGAPSTSSQFQWINGATSRKKILTWTAHPLAPGRAVVGPLTLTDLNGDRITVPAVDIVVLPVAPVDAQHPMRALDELQSSGRDALLLVADAEPKQAVRGEEIVVTWYLYAAENVRGVRLSELPVLTDFWLEEIPVEDNSPQQVMEGGRAYLRVPVRRAALFPIRSGALTIPPMEIIAQTLRSMDDVLGPIGALFEGNMVEIPRRSAPLVVQVADAPAAADAIGDLQLSCTPPKASDAGPVRVDVTLSGRGNLRSVAAPKLLGTVDGRWEMQEGTVKVDRSSDDVRMTRRWTLLVFPARVGSLSIPPVGLRLFDTTTRAMRELQCGGGTVVVRQIAPPAAPAPAPSRGAVGSDYEGRKPLIAVALAILAIAAIVAAFVLHRRSHARIDRTFLSSLTAQYGDPRALRKQLYAFLAERGLSANELFVDDSERGEAFRYLHSWIDLLEKDPQAAEKPQKELKRRLRDFLRAM